MSEDNKWSQPASPPPPLFTGQSEKDFVKQVNDEIIERVVGQTIVYYPISLSHTNYHGLYGEAIEKTFLDPVKIHAMVIVFVIQMESMNVCVFQKVIKNFIILILAKL